MNKVLIWTATFAVLAKANEFGDIDDSYLAIPVFSFADALSFVGDGNGTTTGAPSTGSGFTFWGFFGKYLVPIAALIGGSFCLRYESLHTAGGLMMYFGAQAIMNLYIKETLSSTMVSEDPVMKGVPASFFMTGMQQVVGFICFTIMVFLAGYKPKKLETARDYVAVCIFSVTFVGNFALNNYSLVLLPMTVNLVIRSCNPLATSLAQVLLDRCRGEKSNIPLIDWVLMSVGVGCACLVVWANSQSDHGKTQKEEKQEHLFEGILVCFMSLSASAFNLVLAGCLGKALKLSPIDTVGYMAPPATFLLVFPTFLFSHPAKGWTGHGDMTDWEIVQDAFSMKPILILFFSILGPMAFAYNILQYKLVHNLSPSHVTFAGNFNKFASIVLALVFGIDPFPQYPKDKGYQALIIIVFLIGLAGNIASFTAYSLIKDARKKAETLTPREDPVDLSKSLTFNASGTELTQSLPTPDQKAELGSESFTIDKEAGDLATQS